MLKVLKAYTDPIFHLEIKPILSFCLDKPHTQNVSIFFWKKKMFQSWYGLNT